MSFPENVLYYQNMEVAIGNYILYVTGIFVLDSIYDAISDFQGIPNCLFYFIIFIAIDN